MKWKRVYEIYYIWYEYMESSNHTLQGNVVCNKIQPYLIIIVPIKYGMWRGAMASDSKIWDLK